MSFVFGGTDTNSLAGVTAILEEWPSLGGLAIEAIDLVGRDGRIYAGQSRSHSTFVFDVTIESDDPNTTLSRKDNFIGMLDPSRGPQDLVVEIETAWLWEDVIVSSEINWSRKVWQSDVGYILQANVSLTTVGDPSAREATPQTATFTGSTGFTPSRGNTASFPKLVFLATSASGQPPWVIKIGDFTMNLSAPLATGYASLDWENFEFYLQTAGGTRISSLVPKMSNYKRPQLTPGKAVTVSVLRNGVGVSTTLYPNNRRI